MLGCQATNRALTYPIVFATSTKRAHRRVVVHVVMDTAYLSTLVFETARFCQWRRCLNVGPGADAIDANGRDFASFTLAELRLRSSVCEFIRYLCTFILDAPFTSYLVGFRFAHNPLTVHDYMRYFISRASSGIRHRSPRRIPSHCRGPRRRRENARFVASDAISR